MMGLQQNLTQADEHPVALVIGGSVAHIPLVKALAKRGYRVVLLDYYENPPAKAFCDQHVQESTLDRDAVLRTARDQQAALIINLCLDQPIPIVCEVSEKLGLPGPYSSATAQMVTDKAVMKQVMAENGIPTARHINVPEDGLPDLGKLSFPVMVKPVDSTGSQGIHRADTPDQVEGLVKEARKVSLGGGVLIEEYLEGDELNIHCLVVDGEPHVLLVVRKGNARHPDADAELFIGSVAPYPLSDQEQRSLRVLLTDVVRHFGVRHAPLLVQAFLKDGHFSVIELTARLGGGMGQQLIGLLLDYDVVEAAIDLQLGRKPMLPRHTQPVGAAGTIILYARGGVFGRITGMDALLQEGLIVSGHTYRTPGMHVPEPLSSKSRVGAIVVHALVAEELQQRIAQVVQRIDVLDDQDRSIFVRRLYLTK